MDRIKAAWRIGRLLPALLITALASGRGMGRSRVESSSRRSRRSRTQIYDLHAFIFWICVVIFVVVFGVMFYSIFAHRKSVGHKAAQFHENTHGRDHLDRHPVPDPDAAWRGRRPRPILAMKDTSGAGHDDQGHRLPVEVGLRLPAGRLRLLREPRRRRCAQIENREPKGEHYLLEVDNPLVVPVGKKVRVLITAERRASTPGGCRRSASSRTRFPASCATPGSRSTRPGIYRGQCAELCGKEHGFMPIVVEVKSEAGLRRRGSASRRRRSPPPPTTRTRCGTLEELTARGEKVYAANCVACHQADRQGRAAGVPGARRLEDRRPGRKAAQIDDAC